MNIHHLISDTVSAIRTLASKNCTIVVSFYTLILSAVLLIYVVQTSVLNYFHVRSYKHAQKPLNPCLMSLSDRKPSSARGG